MTRVCSETPSFAFRIWKASTARHNVVSTSRLSAERSSSSRGSALFILRSFRIAMSLLQLDPNDVEPRDVRVVTEVSRFGGLADYQIARRYGDPHLARERIAFLEEHHIIETRRDR